MLIRWANWNYHISKFIKLSVLSWIRFKYGENSFRYNLYWENESKLWKIGDFGSELNYFYEIQIEIGYSGIVGIVPFS